MQGSSKNENRKRTQEKTNAARIVATAMRIPIPRITYRYMACFRKSARGRRPLSSRRSAGCIVRGATRRRVIGWARESSAHRFLGPLGARESYRLRRPCRRVRARAITAIRSTDSGRRGKKKKRESQVARGGRARQAKLTQRRQKPPRGTRTQRLDSI